MFTTSVVMFLFYTVANIPLVHQRVTTAGGKKKEDQTTTKKTLPPPPRNIQIFS